MEKSVGPDPSVTRSFADRFELKSQAGTGGMGTVYQAVDRESGQVVAVKILHSKSGTEAARFEQEAALLAELHHPSIVSYVHHGLTSHGEPYLAMEWLNGETLEERLARGPLSPGGVAALARRVLEALGAAHARGVVHRDIKPSNIFLVEWNLDDVRLLDFGIARRVFDPKRFTRQGSTVGTPMYAAPEQARGDRDTDGRADIFSLGCVLYECLTGEPPFTGESPMIVMAKICVGEVPRLAARCPELAPDLAELVQSMLTQDRKRRPGDAAVLAASFGLLADRLRRDERPRAPEAAAAGARESIGEAEQRVMCALMFSGRSEGAQPAASGDGRLPARRAFGPPGETAVLPAATMADGRLDEVRRVLEPFGGQVDRLLDRSVLVTLPAQAVLRDQAVLIARAALALRPLLPDAALAVGTGRAALLAKLPVGPLVERVGGMLEGAAVGEIAIDETTARLLPVGFLVEEASEGRRLVGEAAEAPESPRKVGGKIGPFVGRDREMTTLAALYEEAAGEGVARTALVLGGPGAGKTRLRQELCARLARSATPPQVILGAGALQRTDARHPLLAGVLAAAGVAREARAPEVQEAFLAFLRARLRAGPVLLVLEDLQWADSASVALVDTALRQLAEEPLVVLALGRPETDESFPSLWSERALERLRLPPLGKRAGQLLVRHFTPTASPETEAFVLERWEGNPFFLEELVASILTGVVAVPDTVLGTVEARLEEIEPEARRILRAGSIFADQAFTPEALVAVLGERSRRDLGAHVELLLARELVGRVPGAADAFRFTNPLVREAAYRMTPAADRSLGRRLARDFLEQSGKTLPDFLAAPHSEPALIAAVG